MVLKLGVVTLPLLYASQNFQSYLPPFFIFSLYARFEIKKKLKTAKKKEKKEKKKKQEEEQEKKKLTQIQESQVVYTTDSHYLVALLS